MTLCKWCSKMATKRLALAIALLVAGGALVVASPARAADAAPDWLRQAAQEKLPDYDKETVAVILLDEIQNTVRDNGEIDVRHRCAIRLLRSEARREFG